MPTATPTPTTTTAATTARNITTTTTTAIITTTAAAAATTTGEQREEEEVPDFNTTQQQQHHHHHHQHQHQQHQHQLTAQMGDHCSTDVGSAAAAAVAAAFDTSNDRWALAEYENFLRGLDHIGNGWTLVQKLIVPPRRVNQTRANPKERWEADWDRGQHNGNEGESKNGDEDFPSPARRGARAGPLPPHPLQAARPGAGTFTATRIQPPHPVLNAYDDRHSATLPPPAGADAASVMSANGGDGGGGGGGGAGMNFVFTLWLGFVRDMPGRTGCQQAVKRVGGASGFRVHYVCRDLFGLL